MSRLTTYVSYEQLIKKIFYLSIDIIQLLVGNAIGGHQIKDITERPQ